MYNVYCIRCTYIKRLKTFISLDDLPETVNLICVLRE